MIDAISGKHLSLSPQVSTNPGETHAALVVSQNSYSDVHFAAGVQTLEQLRTGSAPNAWECAWAVFDYTDNTHFYYVAFKPNGWELGKADPAYPGAQRFLATGSSPAFAVGEEHTFDIQQNGNTITVSIDGKVVTTFTDNERPYTSGKVGFYTEDAKVAFDNVSGSLTETFDNLDAAQFTEGAHVGQWEVPFLGFGTGAIVSDGAAATPSQPLPAVQRPDHIELNDLYRSIEPSVVKTGTILSDNIVGTTGNDLLDGRAGTDVMSGKTGDDTYRVNVSGDSVVERLWEGIDTVLSTATSFTLGANVENLTLVGTGKQTGVGNATSNVLTSNTSQGVLNGKGGHDILISNQGADVLTGGTESDTFIFNFASTTAGGRHITDFQVGVDKIDFSGLLKDYSGADPFLDGHLVLQSNGQGGTNVYVDDGAGGASPVLVTAIDGLAPASLSHTDFYWA